MRQSFSLKRIENIFKGRTPDTKEKKRYFSVMLPLVEHEGAVKVLFEVRARNMKRQPGEVCFPGGKLEKGETPKECAVRETCEELGLSTDDFEISCQLDSQKNAYGHMIYAFLGKIKEEALERIRLSENEVDEIFLVPLSFFTETDPYIWIDDIGPRNTEAFPYEKVGLEPDYDWGSRTLEVPIYNYNGHCIWGLTGRIIKGFSKVLREEPECEL